MLPIILYALLAAILFLSGCKQSDNVVLPDNSGSPINYTWTIDTLLYPPAEEINGGTNITKIWGLNDTIVYAVGRDNIGGFGVLWKFNDSAWSRIKLLKDEGGPLEQFLVLNGIMGFSPNDIYVFGAYTHINSTPPPDYTSSAVLARFDGTRWEAVEIPQGITLYAGAGEYSNDFIIGGTNGQLYKYSLGTWTVEIIQSSFFPELPYYNISVISHSSNESILFTVQYNPNDAKIYYQLLKYKDGKTVLIDSTNSANPKWGLNSTWTCKSGNSYFSGSHGIDKFDGTNWFHENLGEPISTVWGTDDNNIFALGYSGKVFWCDGSSWQSIYTINKTYPVMGSIWCSESSVFISLYQNSKTYIYRGTIPRRTIQN